MSQRTADGFRQFVYQGPDMLKLQLERDESEETVAHYTMGAGLEAMRRETSSFYHYNHLGTALALTGADEAVSDTYRHDAWGVLLERTGSTINPHTYVGRERYYHMPNAEMYHLGFRDYAQGIGRFTTVDPLRSASNDFAYAHNSPPILIDMNGLQPVRLPMEPLPGYLPKCYDVGWHLRWPADKQAYRKFPEMEPTNTLRDAFRHCLWMCLITAIMGSTCAKLVGDGHETKNLLRGAPLAEIEMDRHNNAIGRSVGRQLDQCEKQDPLEPCMEGCDDAEHRLQTSPAPPGDPTPLPGHGGFDPLRPWQPPREV